MTLFWILALLVVVLAYFAVMYGRRAFQGELDLRDLYAAMVFAVLAVGFGGAMHWIRTGAPRPPEPATLVIWGIMGAGYVAAIAVRILHVLRSRKS